MLRAAVRVLAEEGYRGMSFEAVARAAAVGRPATYRRYRDRADLAAAAIAAIGGDVTAPIDTGDTRADLTEFVTRISDAMPHAGIPLLGTVFAERERHPELLARFRERVAEPRRALASALLERGMDRGDVRSDLDVEAAVDHLVGAVFARHITGLPVAPGWAEQTVLTRWRGISC
ncbi:TetR-like C-terminal domain-containing protein [Streptomyces milbemycinicus]|uniref:TetR-like C-terminal domain-containing protein n=1 Tax=Streptomyces milbemycinicus TaxID=476552 RepID=A0ABW8LRY0_9ACTN